MTEGQLHEIIVKYRDVGGVGDRIAGAYGWIATKIRGFLPSNFMLEGIQIDKTENKIHIIIFEYGNNVIQVPIVLGIVAIILVVAAFFYMGYEYKENGILQHQNQILTSYYERIQEIINDPALSDEQKIAQIQTTLTQAKAAADAAGSGGIDWGSIITSSSGLIAVAVIGYALLRKK